MALSFADGLTELARSSAPAWIWSQDGQRLLWANAAGGTVFDASRFVDLSERQWPPHDPLRRDIHNLARALGDAPTFARLRVVPGIDRLPAMYRVRRIRSGTGVWGVLVEGLAGIPGGAEGADDFLAAPDQPETSAVLGITAKTPVSPARAPASIVPRESPPAKDTAPASVVPALQSHEKASDAWEKVAAELPEWVRSGFGLATGTERASDTDADARPASVPSGEESTRTAPGRDLRLVVPASPGSLRAAASAPSERTVSAGRVDRDLSRKPVRFLWQTDAADRFLFVSPGLAQVVGRNAEIVGERWAELASRLNLDPPGRIGAALGQRDTWSGLTAWWPIEGSGVRVPAELTALPVFGGDHSFQGYRGFGVLRPAEALMPPTFEARYSADSSSSVRQSSAEEDNAAAVNVVPIRADVERLQDMSRLSPQERSAFEEIAASLQQRIGTPHTPAGLPLPRAPEAPPSDAGADRDEVQPAGTPAPPAEPIGPAVSVLEPTDSGDQAGALASEQPVSSRQGELGLDAAAVGGRAQPQDSAAAPGSPVEPTVVDADLQRRLEEMTAILDTATDGILILDAMGIVERANASAEALFGMEAAELQGMLFVDLLTEESRITALDYLGGLKEHGVASLLNEGREVEAKAGTRAMPLFMTLGRISSDNGGRYCALLRDLTHWKRTEADLIAARRKAEAASSQKSDFLARVSHEIRTPLNAVIGFAEVMIEERFGSIGNDRYREYLRDIRLSGEHVVSLVNDLLDISKIEAGKLDLSFVAVPLNDLVRECITLMQPQAGRARVVLRSSLSREVPGIVADERTMRQIVLNLLSNSVKFTGPGGQVIASTSLAESGEAILRVRDTGEGMSEEELVRALEPFRQISTSTMGNRAGTGLGLPLTKALVEANRASFEIRSTPGEGTVVKVTFPPTRVLSE